MKVHLARVIEGRMFGVPATRTTTLCGRASIACDDGLNSTDDPKKVTCAFCRRAMSRPRMDQERAG